MESTRAGRSFARGSGDDRATGKERGGEDLLVVHERLAERTGSCRVPEPGRFGSAECEHHGGVAAKNGSVDHVRVVHGFTDGAAGVAVPDLRGPIEAASQDTLAVGTEFDAPDVTLVRSGWPIGFMV